MSGFVGCVYPAIQKKNHARWDLKSLFQNQKDQKYAMFLMQLCQAIFKLIVMNVTQLIRSANCILGWNPDHSMTCAMFSIHWEM